MHPSANICLAKSKWCFILEPALSMRGGAVNNGARIMCNNCIHTHLILRIDDAQASSTIEVFVYRGDSPFSSRPVQIYFLQYVHVDWDLLLD